MPDAQLIREVAAQADVDFRTAVLALLEGEGRSRARRRFLMAWHQRAGVASITSGPHYGETSAP